MSSKINDDTVIGVEELIDQDANTSKEDGKENIDDVTNVDAEGQVVPTVLADEILVELSADQSADDVESAPIQTDESDALVVLEDEENEVAEAGFSDIYDGYGRELLDRTFENILCMSKNTVKLIYSRIKNAIFEYKDVKAKFDGEKERFRRQKEDLFLIEIDSGKIVLNCAIDPKSLDKEVYPHNVVKRDDNYKNLRTQLILSDLKAIPNTIELINLTMDTKRIPRLSVFVPLAYAEKYPVNLNGVLRGEEEDAPIDGKYSSSEYEDIYGELTARFISEKSEEEKADELSLDETEYDNESENEEEDESENKESGAVTLQKRRQTAKSIAGAIALAEPIVYFYNVAEDKNNNVAYVNVQQVLNDKFLGKLLPQHYFAIAEGSERIEELNFIALRVVRETCDANPSLSFAIQVSCRLLIKAATLSKLVKECETKNNNLIMALDCALLDSLGDAGISALRTIKNSGIRLMADNSEQSGIKALTTYAMDFIRFDCRYYKEANQKELAYLKLVSSYCATNGLISVAQHCDVQKDAMLMLNHGVFVIEGMCIGEPKRLLHVAMKERKKLAVIEG
ncbi:MAG: EAL domain-containing protein [Christensenellaceae bacterium]|jgi:EAL domain-containing protein (putative c-di-GMP-specific phosphodiesterase class I)|nr:EAL domain-containing protein [Christensenellaceae bacterium]